MVTSEALGHERVKSYYYGPPTCISHASYNIDCSRCGQYLNEWGTDPATGIHTPDEGVITRVGDCITETIVEYTCLVCGRQCGEERYKTDDHVWVEKQGTTFDYEIMDWVTFTALQCDVCNEAYSDYIQN